MAPDEDGVAGRDDEVLCADVADERFKAGVAEDGLDTLIVDVDEAVATGPDDGEDSEGVEVEEGKMPEEAPGNSSISTLLEVIVLRMLWYRLSSCWRCSWSVDCVRCVWAESLPEGRCHVVVLFTWSM